MSDRSAKSIPLRRAVLGGLALLAAGLAIGLGLGEMSGPTLASAPNPPPAKPGELTNTGSEPSRATNPLGDLARNSQERDSALPTTAPLDLAQPLQRTGPINGLMASAAGMMPLLPGDTETLNDRIATVLGTGTPTPQALEQLVNLVNAASPTATPSPIVQAGGPSPTPNPGPLPPPIYDGTNSNKASPN